MSTPIARALAPSVRQIVRSVMPDATVVAVEPLQPDLEDGGGEHKATGYGAPLKVAVQRQDGRVQSLVVHFEAPNEFGHDRRADRAANILLSWDDFAAIPGHVKALDVGILMPEGRLLSLREGGELYLLTEWVDGEPYAEDLRRLAERGEATPRDRARVLALAEAAASIHKLPGTLPPAYTRAIRDLLGHGEGIFGIVDGFGDAVPGASPVRLEALERRCLAWRWKLRHRTGRLRRTHGDLHPWNIIFGTDDRPFLLDTSRGSQGDPADDVGCLSLNYVFFGLLHRDAWPRGFRPLWRLFWDSWLERTGDAAVLEVVAPFLAWRALVMANPAWYPDVQESTRDALLGLVERALDAPRFDPAWADELF